MRDELRAARLQLEYLKPEILQRDRGITATVVVFGSARVPAPEDAAALSRRRPRAVGREPRTTPSRPQRAHRPGLARRAASTTRPAGWRS